MMIALRDILIFLAGAGLLYVAQLTQRYFYGKRIIASNLTQREEPYKPRKIVPGAPPAEAGRFDSLIKQINTQDEFAETHSKNARTRLL